MAAPTIVNLAPANIQPKFRGFPQQNPLEAIMRGSQTRKRDDNQMLAILLSILQQQQQLKQSADESSADRDLRRDLFDEQRRASAVSESQGERQLEEILAGQVSNREFQEREVRQRDIGTLLAQESAKVGTRGARDLARLELGGSAAERTFAEDLTRGRDLAEFITDPIDRALEDILDTDNPTTVQIGKLEKALRKAGESVTSSLTGSLADDGVTQGELIGVTEQILDRLNEITSYARNLPDERTRAKFESVLDTRRELLSVLRPLKGPGAVFGEELDALKQRGIDVPEAMQPIFDQARQMMEQGKSVETIRDFIQAEKARTVDTIGTQDSFNPSFDVGDPALKSVLDALGGLAPETQRATTGSLLGVPVSELSPAAQDVFSGEAERRERVREDESDRFRREGELQNKMFAQQDVGSVGPAIKTGFQLFGSKLAGDVSGIGEFIRELLSNPSALEAAKTAPVPSQAAPSDPDLAQLLLELQRQEALRGLESGGLDFGGF